MIVEAASRRVRLGCCNMKLKLNMDYAKRHLFVTALMAGLCCWFGYDGFVRYPATPAAELFKSIEGREPNARELEGDFLDKFKEQKTKTQYGFTLLAGLAALVVGLRLLASYKFAFEFDDEGFVYQGKRRAYSDIKKVDRSQWEKKGIIRIDGIVLDAWHHVGVKEFVEKLP